jgi:hypothetical protein
MVTEKRIHRTPSSFTDHKIEPYPWIDIHIRPRKSFGRIIDRKDFEFWMRICFAPKLFVETVKTVANKNELYGKQITNQNASLLSRPIGKKRLRGWWMGVLSRTAQD